MMEEANDALEGLLRYTIRLTYAINGLVPAERFPPAVDVGWEVMQVLGVDRYFKIVEDEKQKYEKEKFEEQIKDQ